MAGVRRRGSGAVLTLDADETSLLRVLLTDLEALLDADERPSDPLEELAGLADAATTPPEDPALARLLPDGYRDDPEAAASLRRLSEGSLRQGKSEAAQVVLSSLPERGGKIRLDGEQLAAWLGAFNDLRLVLGTRLDITEESDPLGGHPADAPEAAPFVIYQWLTAVQDNLVQILLR